LTERQTEKDKLTDMEKINKLSDVFGNSRNIPLTYQTRVEVDDRFVNDLTREKHLVLHGGSKQGKTCLRKYHLGENEAIVIQCTRDTTKAGLYEMILKKAEIEYEVTNSKTTKGSNKVTVKVTGKGKIPFLAEGGGDAGYESLKENTDTKSYKNFEIDIEDPNDVVRILMEDGFNKYIVIEDFHYLNEELQMLFAFDLKVFHETSPYVFIIIGVWMESDRLTVYNGDLTGRITNINVDVWSADNLKKVIDNGKPLLNIDFNVEVETLIVNLSQDNVGLLQEICYRLCEKYEIWHTQSTNKTIGTENDVIELAKKIADDQSSRYRNFIIKFSEGLSVTELEMYKWIMYSVLNSSSDDLRKGISASRLFSIIKPKHPKSETLQLTNLNQALERVQTVQAKHKLQPLILDFSNGDLFVVDANFLVYISIQDKNDLLKQLNLE
jgi:hypothetical protein